VPKNKKGFMDLETYKKIIDELNGFTYELFFYLGGEPLLHPKIFEMIEYANKKNFYTVINTNATLLTGKKITKFLDAQPDQIEFSLDTFDEINYNNDKKNAIYSDTLKNIFDYLQSREKSKKIKNKIRIRMMENYFKDENRKIKQRLHKYSNVLVYYHMLQNWGGKIKIPIKRSKASYVPCVHIWGGLGIKWDGKVVPCCKDFLGDYILGDIHQDSLKNIWNNPKMRLLREKLSKRRSSEIKLCVNCDALNDKTIFSMPMRSLITFLKDRFMG